MKRKLLFVLFFSLIAITVCFGKDVTLAELAYLANDCYNNYEQKEDVGYGFRVEKWSNSSGSGFNGVAYTKKNIVVIAFRGTDDPKDLIADQGIMLTSDSSLFSFVSFLNFTGYGPSINVGDMIAAKAELDQQIEDAFNFYKKVDKQEKKVVIVGHSLGGYLAQIVGCKNNIQTYTFNAPGARTYLPADFKVTDSRARKIHNYVANNGLNLVPRGTYIGERNNIGGYTHSMKEVYDTIKNNMYPVPIEL